MWYWYQNLETKNIVMECFVLDTRQTLCPQYADNSLASGVNIIGAVW